ncbi:substrate-binding periplasmic protein [Marinibaculum pumilum]|uniref:Substrate-binding periplasmic protein n=1 Tax=Marinibaculum pumilum TaxID=1766165 RepID=A0ABV7KUX7_9PROT
MRRAAAFVAAAVALLPAGLPARDAVAQIEIAGGVTPLRVCMEANSPPFSVDRRAEGEGFDLAITRAVAEALSRPLTIVWFRSEEDEESSLKGDVQALLGGDLCDLVGGYLLDHGTLKAPTDSMRPLPEIVAIADGPGGTKRAVLEVPEIVRLTDGPRKPLVPPAAIDHSRAYRFAPLAVMTGPALGVYEISSLDALDGKRIGVEEGTLADTILMLYRQRKLVDSIIHYVPHGGLIADLAAGNLDFAMMELHRFDTYRRRQKKAEIHPTGYLHPVGFNFGFVARAEDRDLLDAVDQALDRILAGEAPARFAAEAEMTYVPPRAPDIQPAISLGYLLRGD